MKPTEEEVVVIEFVNYEKHIINFVKNQENFGFFKYGPQFKNPRIGDLLRVKLEKSPDNNYYKVLSLKHALPDDSCEALMTFNGPITIAPKSGFGFVNEIFIYPRMVKQFNLVDGQTISGKAVLSFDKKKNTWGWIGCRLDV